MKKLLRTYPITLVTMVAFTVLMWAVVMAIITLPGNGLMVPQSQAAQIVPTQIVVAQSALAATPTTISFEVPADKLPRIKAAMAGIYPIPQIPDPEWVDPEDGSEAPMVDEFGPGAWAKEAIRRLVKRDVARWERKVAAAAAVDAITEDDDLLN